MKPGRPQGYMTSESRETTALMVLLRTDERLKLEEIGEIFGVTREAVRLRLKRADVDAATRETLRSGWKKRPPPYVLTPRAFAALVRAWLLESGCWYCPFGRHVLEGEPRNNGRMCRECNRLRKWKWRAVQNPKVQRRSPAQVDRIRRARFGY